MTELFLQGAALGVAAAALPGPFQAFLLGEAVRYGWRRSLPLAFAPLLSDGPIILLIFLVLSRLPATLLTLIKLGGGLFILYLAYHAALAFRHYQAASLLEDTAHQGVLKGALMNLLNPNPWLFWSLAGVPILLEAWQQSRFLGLWFLLSFYSVFVLAVAVLIALFALAGKLGPQVNRGLLGLSALALSGFGLYQLVTGLLTLG